MTSRKPNGGRRFRLAGAVAIGTAAVVLLSGCTSQASNGWLPSERDITDRSHYIWDLWINSWIAALAVGLLVWGLILWCIIAYRRRKTDKGYPRQLSYNLPIEIFYTFVPLAMVFVLFYFTDVAQTNILQRSDHPDLVVDVRAKQWSWDFNYVQQNTYDSGTQAHLDGQPGAKDRLPTLYLPVNKTVEFQLNARDVIHSFWVPAFLEKMDMIPGKTNYLTITPQKEGQFDGKCTELCGEYHSEMLFNVKVVSQAEFDQHMQQLRDGGHSGQIGKDYDRNADLTPNAVSEG
ncbi:cytochrome c oxidase subunit II [Tersicoccus sp. MR15.9]|uniref:aa3-type cytochrome oxidase subunit II n=1 Tax=Tersicoccus mangrovi TaxID=3121635 RepID=UPI002FE5C3AB